MPKEDMTFEEAGKKLSDLAQMTATNSKNWKNFAEIATSMIKQAYEAGQASANDQKDWL